jgi:N-methylhydantoinase B
MDRGQSGDADGPPATRTAIDPIRFEVIRNALVEIAEEMAASLRRSAYSTNIKTRADFSCAFFDAKMRAIAQSFAQPSHLGSLVRLVPAAVADYGPERLGPGDSILVNHPYIGGGHLNDVTLIAPFVYGGEVLGYVACLAHHVDVGGGAPASVGAFQEVFQEGIIIPPVKLVENGAIVPDIYRLVLEQIRSKRETAGDLRAQIACNNTGVRRLTGLVDQMGAEPFVDYLDELCAYTGRRTMAAIAGLPHGSWAADGLVDTDGFSDEPVHLSARFTVDDEGVLFDLTGSDVQRRAPVNSTYAQTYSNCAYVLKSLIDPDIPVNDGFYRYVRVLAPAGTVVNATHPAPVVGGWETAMRLVETLYQAIAPALPDRVPAGSKGMICHVGFGGRNPRDGELFAFLETVAGGFGGRVSSDGPDAVQPHPQNTENAPVEETEINYPVRILRYEMIEESEGPGTHRGGLGLRRDYTFEDDVSFTILADRDRWGPSGLFGGMAAPPARYILNPDTDPTTVSSKTTLSLHAGDVISIQSCGGGGYGPADERDPAAVLKDVLDGRISAGRAADLYRVAVDVRAGTVDAEKTAGLRLETA